jgi:hypothetical protein
VVKKPVRKIVRALLGPTSPFASFFAFLMLDLFDSLQEFVRHLLLLLLDTP